MLEFQVVSAAHTHFHRNVYHANITIGEYHQQGFPVKEMWTATL